MKWSLAAVCVALLLSGPAAWAQSSSGDNNNTNTATGTSLADQQPAENVCGAAVQQRAPGRIIDLARARHRELRDQRLAAQRTGETYLLAPEGAGGSYSSPLGGSLSNLISSFLNTGLAGVVGGVDTGVGSSGIDTSNLPPEVIQMLADYGIDLKDLNQKSSEASAAGSATQSKSSSRMQTDDGQEQSKFLVRWADAMLSTVFTALTVGFQTTDFIDLLKDVFRPFFFPSGANTDAADGTPSTDQGADSGGASGGSDADGASGDEGAGEPLI